jgi:hypothetical protein
MDPHKTIPIQIYFLAYQLEVLHAISDRWHVSLEDIARQGIGTFLIGQRMVEEPLSDNALEDDPLRAIIGMFSSDVGDLAENHDKYLMEFEMESNQQWPKKSS